MTLPVPSFGSLGPTFNLSLFDSQFNAVANMGIIYCTAIGSNAITLTPIANTLTPASYLDGAPLFAWKQAQNSTSTVTINVAGLGTLNAYKQNGATAVGGSDLVAGLYYTAVPLASLNSGAGGFVVDVVPTALATAGSIWAGFKNLEVAVTGDTTLTISADQLALFDGTNYATATNVNVGGGIGTSGANGLDTGSAAQGVFYSVWVIQNSSGANASLLSTNATTPSMPSGYVLKARVGWVTTAAAAVKLLKTIQLGRRAQYIMTGVTPNTALPTIISGAAGTINSTTFTPTGAAWSAVAPSTAASIKVVASNAGTSAAVAFAPEASYAGWASATNPVPFVITGATPLVGELVLSGAAIGYASAGASGLLQCLGWEDNI